MAPYTHTTLSDLTTQLGQRLADPSNIHWTLLELQNASIEALRIFQSLTSYYRERVILPTVLDTTYYDLRYALTTTLDGYPYNFSVTDDQLLSEIQSHLIEPATNPWTGTAQFSIGVIASSLQRARDQFLSISGSYVTQAILPNLPAGMSRIALPAPIIDVRRAAWIDVSGSIYGLVRTDEYAMAGYSQSWFQNSDLPYSYSVAVTPPLAIQIAPVPINSGLLDVCLLSSGPALPCDPLSPVILGIHDDYSWGVKYRALADLLSEDGPAFDPDRAKYCAQMFNLASSLAAKPISVLQAIIGSSPVQVGAIEEYDRYQTNWQNQTHNVPSAILQIAPNLLALSPIPNGAYSIALDMARSMVVPITSGVPAPASFIQVSEEFIDSILDLAQHILSFKLGGSEFGATSALRDNFLRMAALQNNRLKANIFYNILLNQPATKPELEVPRLSEEANSVSSV